MPSTVEYLNFDAVGAFPSLALNLAGCWECTDYAQMYDGPPVVGENRPIPGATGRLAVQREEDEAVINLPMVFRGVANHLGVPYADARIGVRTNLRFFRTNILRPLAAQATRPVTFHRLDTGTESGDVIVQSPMAMAFQTPAKARGVLVLIVPAAVLA